MDWAQLNTDLLRLIFKKLGDFGSFVYFRCVCKNWSLAIEFCDHPLQLPWLLQYNSKIKVDDYITDYEYFSLQSNRTHALHIPGPRYLNVLGQTKRYLIIVNFVTRTASFLNPFTRTQFDIPGIPHHAFDVHQPPIFVGPNPTENDEIVIMRGAGQYGRTCLFVISIQSDGKVFTRTVEIDEMHTKATLAYNKGRLFSSYDKTTKVLNVKNGEEILSIREPTLYKFQYLIEVCGDMLGVVYQPWSAECKFVIYRFEEDGAEPRWVKILDIGDNMLFLDYYCHCVCLKASDYDGFTGNCIYFLENNRNGSYDLVRYDLKNNNTQILPYRTNYPLTLWFVPCLY